MANPNPYKARRAKQARQTRAPGDIKAVQARLWGALEAACGVLDDPESDAPLRLRAVHAVTQATATYAKVLEATEFEGRLRALEDQVNHANGL